MEQRHEPGDGRAARWGFIAGEGRSGTTLLGVLVARATSGFNCGELRQLWSRRARGGLCECGAELTRCPVWSDVVGEVQRTFGGRLSEALTRYERLGQSHNKLRYPRPGAAYVALRAATEAAVERVTAAEVIVDASKGPLDLAAALERRRPLVVSHLVRDPRGVAFSWRRAKPPPDRRGESLQPAPVWKAAVLWSRDNYVIERLMQRAGRGSPDVRTVRLSYERLATDPAAAIGPVTAALGGGRTANGAAVHGIAGNAALYSGGPVVIDDRWRQAMPWRDRLTASALTAPLLHRYGYALWPATPPAPDDRRPS